jgi:hypothetical protein
MKLVQTGLTNEVVFQAQPDDCAALGIGEVLRSDRLPAIPPTVYFGTLQPLAKPEPLRRTPKKKRR